MPHLGQVLFWLALAVGVFGMLLVPASYWLACGAVDPDSDRSEDHTECACVLVSCILEWRYAKELFLWCLGVDAALRLALLPIVLSCSSGTWHESAAFVLVLVQVASSVAYGVLSFHGIWEVPRIRCKQTAAVALLLSQSVYVYLVYLQKHDPFGADGTIKMAMALMWFGVAPIFGLGWYMQIEKEIGWQFMWTTFILFQAWTPSQMVAIVWRRRQRRKGYKKKQTANRICCKPVHLQTEVHGFNLSP